MEVTYCRLYERKTGICKSRGIRCDDIEVDACVEKFRASPPQEFIDKMEHWIKNKRGDLDRWRLRNK